MQPTQQDGTVVEGMGPKPGGQYSTISLCLSFPISKMGFMTIPSLRIDVRIK